MSRLLRSRMNGRGWRLITGGFVLTFLGGLATFASDYGANMQSLSDHVNPERHALIVLAGDAKAAERLVQVEAAQATVADKVQELSDKVEGLRTDQSAASAERGKIMGALEVLLKRDP